MGGLGRSTKRAKISQVPKPDPVPSPVPLDIEVEEKERARRRQRIRQFGRAGTILTAGGLGTSEAASKKGTLLGGSATA